jgi:hypothetical protein
MPIGREMPKYKCHKEVWALKIKSIVFDSDLAKKTNQETDGSATITPEEEGYGPFKVNSNYVQKHNPKVGGYYVLYKGGYPSWSPAEDFEEGYSLIKEDFKTRLLDEKEQLENRLNKLDSFLESEKINEIEDTQKALLQV